MKLVRVVSYVDEDTHGRLVAVADIERRSVSALAASILAATLKDAPDADWGSMTSGADGPEPNGGGGDTSASPGSPRRPGPVARTLQRRERT